MHLIINNIKVKLKIFLITTLSIAFCNSLFAAPGNIPQSPLFLETSVEPNIFWVLDDSGSMEWELSCPEGSSGIPNFGGTTSTNYYILPSPNNYRENGLAEAEHHMVVDTVEKTADAWRARNHNFNTLYYNPATTYKPWAGADINGTPLFTNSDPESADADPVEPGSGFLNLTLQFSFENKNNSGVYDASIYPAQYYEWTDDNDNGYVDPSDGNTLIKIHPDDAPFIHTNSQRTDCSDPTSCIYAEEIQNFANWYTFYRKRGFIARAAMGDLINSASSSRMGLELFNNGLSNDIASMSLENNRIDLLNSIYGLCIACNSSASSYGTPARRSFKKVGEFFSGASSPILPEGSGGECQQNFSILITDGYWNGPDPDVGNCDANSANIFDGGIYADAFPNTLADVAMKYYKTDLKPDIADKVPTTIGVDEASHQHLVTYSVALGVTGTIDYKTESPSDPSFKWPDPTSSNPAKIDDVWHAAVNGRGKYLSAQNHLELSSSLNEALSGIEDQTGSAAAITFNSSTITSNNSTFVVMFKSNYWSGMIYNYDINVLTGEISTTSNWEASDNLDNRNLQSDDRTIITHNGADGVPFRWGSLNEDQKNDLKTNSTGNLDSDAIGQERLNYIRGSRSNEAKKLNFRKRSSRLGDIIHSAPVYVGKPQLGWSDSEPFPTDNTYSSWRKSEQISTRVPMVYVGANDGMLHGFRASDGKEVLAYVPSSVYSDSVSEGLHYLVNEGYMHRYYVDATPKISDVYMQLTQAGSAKWNTILVGSLRGGGREIYALDITNPTDFSESNASDIVLWEFADEDLGYTFGDPTITLMNNGKWAAVFSNGYNSTGTGEAQLFIAFIEDGIDGWSSDDFIKISTKSGSLANLNGLSTPAVIDLDGNGTADRVYAGDLFGNMWVFDLTSENSASWDVAYKNAAQPTPLFSAGIAQPITQEPIIVNHPNVNLTDNNAPNLMVFFGTGQYLVDTDKASTSTQSMYGIWDNGTKELAPSNLIKQTFESTFSSDVRVLSNNKVQYSDTDDTKRFGWQIDLPIPGERIITKPFFRDQNVFFNTMIPSSGLCDYGGSGWLLGVGYVNGSRPEADSQIFDTNGDDIIDSHDLVTNEEETLENVGINGMKFLQGIPAESSYFGDYQYTPGTSTKNGDPLEKMKIKSLPNYLGASSWKEVLIE